MREEDRLTIWRVLAVGLMGVGLSHWTDSRVWTALLDERYDGVRYDGVRPQDPAPYDMARRGVPYDLGR